ncbi:MAG: phosphotransferase [Acidimicrobiia bacterium]
MSPSHTLDDAERYRLLRLRPPSQTLAWVEETLGAKVTRVRVLLGGRSSAMHVLYVAWPSETGAAVLRRSVVPLIHAKDPDIAGREARVLQRLEATPVPAPQLLAVDPTGAETDVPTILMARLPGRLDGAPKGTDQWLRGLAGVLPAIHAAPLTSEHGIDDFRPYDPESGEPPTWMQAPALWERALEIFHGPRLDPDRVFIHRDFHLANVLWHRGRLSGVVDWQAASMGPPSVDVSWCRGNLIGNFGLETADRFVRIWEEISGRSFHPWAEVVLLVDLMSWPVERTRQEREDLECALAQRLSELGK